MSWYVVCTNCGRDDVPADQLLAACPNCGGEWLDPRYDYDRLGRVMREETAARPCTMWRFREWLPVHDDDHIVTMGEGGTPLLRLKNLSLMLGVPNLYLKDERQGPTASFKDRQASLAISVLREHGVREVVVASTGNVAISYSAYAAQAGIKLWTFLTSSVPADKMREVALYGSEVVKVTATYDRTKQVAARFAEQRGLFLDRGIKGMAARESMKTIAYEIAQQLGWRSPDWYIQAVSGGLGPVGVLKGFWELREMGLVETMPKIACIQAAGCAPMVKAWEQGLSKPVVVDSPQTLITTVATGDPGIAYEILYQAAVEHGGAFVAVTDEEAFRAMHVMAKMDGFSMEPAAAMACAGAIKMIRQGLIRPDETVVICCSGHTFPVEKHLLEENWSHHLDLSAEEVVAEEVEEPTPAMAAREEGLLTSFEELGGDVRRIAIVEDDEPARVLLRRILQAYGDFEIFEAADGRQGIQMIREVEPDVVLLDLMMPEVDGYQVLEAIKSDPKLQHIPVIVITAARLSAQERKRLDGHVRSLLQKGQFVDRELLESIQAMF